MAEKMGYKPNLHASALAHRRAARVKRSNRESVAVLYFIEEDYSGIKRNYDETMAIYVANLGLDFTCFNLQEYPNCAVLARVLKARGYSGILLDRIMTHYDFGGFPWADFSVVCAGRQFEERPFDMVRESVSDTLRNALKLVQSRGYKRPGVCLFKHPMDMPDDHARIGEVLFHYNYGDAKGMVPPFIDFPHYGEKRSMYENRMLKWFAENQPDVVIGFAVSIFYNLIIAGWSPPRDAGFLGLIVNPFDRWQANVSGYVDPARHITEVAMDRMSFLIRHGRTGIPEKKLELLLNAEWWEGTTLPLRA